MAREMIDSGCKYLGIIPKTWKVNKFKYYLFRRDVKNRSDCEVLSLYREHGIVIKNSRDDNHNVTSEDTSKYRYVRINDFVVNKMKAWQGSVAVSEYEGIVSPAYYVYEFSDDSYCPKYFHYLLRSAYKNEFRRLSGGIREGQGDLSTNALENIIVILPPLPEQQKIAAFLDDKCAEFDSLIADIQREIEKLERLRQLVITEAVTRGVDNSLELINSGVDWIGKIPKGWKIMHFKYCAKIKSNLVSPTKYLDFPQISPDSIEKNTGKIIDYKTVEESGIISDNHLFFKGQIVYSKIRPTLNKVIIAPFDGLCSADMYPIEAVCNTKFLLYAMLSYYFVSQVGLVTQNRVKMPKINQDELGVMNLAIPNDDTQQKIVEYLDARCAEFETILSEKQKQIEILQKLKKSVIYEYVTGKKEVK